MRSMGDTRVNFRFLYGMLHVSRMKISLLSRWLKLET